MFGLSRQWLLYDGVAIAAAFVLSHPEQLDRMTATVPEAVPAAALVGDPCFDRMLASRPHRSRYRRALGIPDGRVAVVVSSTWSAQSLLGAWPDLLRQLVAELPADEYQIIAIVHPNVTQGHGPFQLRSWLAEPLRSGLILIPPEHGWQAALVAADLVIGDYGSGTAYGAALGRPVLLGSFPDDEVAPDTAVHRLGALAPRLDRAAPLRSQVTAALAGHTPDRYADITALTSAFPGEAAGRLRALCYRLLGRTEPLDEPTTRPYDATGLAPAALPHLSVARVECQVDGVTVRVRRYAPAPVPLGLAAYPGRLHTAAHQAHPGRRAREAATLVFGYADEPWTAGSPQCPVTAVLRPAGAELYHRDHGRWTITVDAADPPDPAALASAALAWLDRDATPEEATIDVDLGYRVVPAAVTATP